MPNTKITRQKWKDHFSYAKRVYLIGALIAAGVASLIFSVTRYIVPNERAVTIQLVDTYANPAKLDNDLPSLLAAGQAFDSSLEEVSFLTIAYNGEDTADYSGSQVYTVQVYAGDNDIYLQNKLLTDQMINEGYVLALETLEGFDVFNEKYGEYVIWQAIEKPEGEEEEDYLDYEEHAYSIDVSSLLGINQKGAYDVREKYAVIMISSENAATSFHVLAEMFDLFRLPEVTQ